MNRIFQPLETIRWTVKNISDHFLWPVDPNSFVTSGNFEELATREGCAFEIEIEPRPIELFPDGVIDNPKKA